MPASAPRRLAITTAAGLLAGLALLGLSGRAAAQDWPAAGKTIQLVTLLVVAFALFYLFERVLLFL